MWGSSVHDKLFYSILINRLKVGDVLIYGMNKVLNLSPKSVYDGIDSIVYWLTHLPPGAAYMHRLALS